MAKSSSHLKEKRSSHSLLISTHNSLDETIIGTMGVEEEDAFGNRGEEGCQKGNNSEEEGEG